MMYFIMQENLHEKVAPKLKVKLKLLFASALY